MQSLSVLITTLLLAVLTVGCATSSDRAFVPLELVKQAEIKDFSNVRGWGDEPPSLEHFKAMQLPGLKAKYQARGRQSKPLESNILALSGGGENGAFGAGLLVGWSERGDRPDFDLVTGVSAGALIAPFAFLGRSYDRQLSELFTQFDSDQIYELNILAGVLGGSAVASNAPLKSLIDRFVDLEMMRQLAQQRSAGRILLIGTTNLDAERPVYWDIGRIAEKGTKEALELIRSVLLASAAIPGVFPPVRICVVAAEKTYEELHVDGGPTRQVFLSPSDFSFREIDKALGRKVTRNLYVIRNGKLGPEWDKAGEGLLSISQRSLYATTKYQALGDLSRIYAKAGADGIGFHLAAIPDSFNAALPEPFNRGYMTALYEVGLRLGREGYPWMNAPPGVGVAASR